MTFKDDILIAHMALKEGEKDEALGIFSASLRKHRIKARVLIAVVGAVGGCDMARDLKDLRDEQEEEGN